MTDQPEVVVVTGASAGLGRAIVQEFARHGAYIGLLARGSGLEEAAAEAKSLGARDAIAIPTDVSDPEAVEAAAERVERDLGPIDIWINDAMESVFSPIKEMTPADYRRVTEVTYLGYVNGTLSALERMLPRDKGVIVQVGSALAYRGIPLQSAYCASKHAIQGFMDSLYCELLHDRSQVKATMVQMPALNTPQFDWVKTRLPNHPQPVPPIYEPEVGARAVYYAAHHPRREMWVGMPTVGAIFLNKFIPGLLDRYLAATGYKSQQTNQPIDSNTWRDNLYEPVPGDHGAHGDFTDRSHSFSPQLWLDMHRGAALGVAAAVGLGAWAALRGMRGKG